MENLTPDWMALTEPDGARNHFRIEAMKRIKELPVGCEVYVEKEPVVVQENYEYVHGLIAAYEAGGSAKR